MVEDGGPPPGNPWRGYQLCLRSFLESEFTQAVVVQDDTIVCQNFEVGVARIAAIFPDHPVCLFYPGLKMRSARGRQKAVQARRSFFLLDRQDFVPMVAVLWPRAKAEHFLNWTQGRTIPGLQEPYRSDDAVAGSWMRHTKQAVYVTMPSLVEHPDDVAPVKDGHHKAAYGADKGRIAHSFHAGDPLDLDWSV